MNNLIVDIDNLPIELLPILSDEEAGRKYKQWSFVNIYSLTALRDIYKITHKLQDKSVKSITAKVNELKIKKRVTQRWEPLSERFVLENLNALVKFDLLNKDYSIKELCFQNGSLNSELNDEDIRTLEHVYFNYFRFKELSTWFIDPSPEFHKEFYNLKKQDFIDKSCSLFFYSDESRFNNSFFKNIDDPKVKYIIKNDIVMRFWDVYLSWGTTLNILDKFNITQIYKPIKNNKLSVVYFIKEFTPFDLETFILNNFNSRNIWIPELIYKIAVKFSYSVSDIKKFIIKNIDENDKFTFERTSEIFLIKGKKSEKNVKEATYLYPLMDNYYISNIIIRK